MQWLIPPAQLAGHNAYLTEVWIMLWIVGVYSAIAMVILMHRHNVGPSVKPGVVAKPPSVRLESISVLIAWLAVIGIVLIWFSSLRHNASCYGPAIPLQEVAWHGFVADLPSCSDAQALARLNETYRAAVMLSVGKQLGIVWLVITGLAWVIKRGRKPTRPAWNLPLVIAVGLTVGAVCELIMSLQ